MKLVKCINFCEKLSAFYVVDFAVVYTARMVF